MGYKSGYEARGIAWSATDLGAQRLCRRAWWVFFIGGLASVVFGIVAIVNPTIALFFIASFFAASVLTDGAVNALAGLRHRNKDGWWTMALLGIAGAVAGGYALMNPEVTMAAFVLAAAFMAAAVGVSLVALGYKIRKQNVREWILYLAGGLSLLFGGMIFIDPREYGPSLVILIAVWALLVGSLRIWFAFRVRAWSESSGVGEHEAFRERGRPTGEVEVQ
ncbi:MAG: DUF308 domain-containing protein [Burkholderiaceae bacterium]